MTYQLQNDYVSYWNTSLTQIEEEQLTEDITNISNQIVVIQGQISTIQGQISTLQSEVDTLQSDVVTLQGQVTTLQGQVTTLQGQVATLQSQVATLQSQVATLQSDVSTIQSQIITIQSDIASIQAELLALHTYFYSISIECETLQVNESLTVNTSNALGYEVNVVGDINVSEYYKNGNIYSLNPNDLYIDYPIGLSLCDYHGNTFNNDTNWKKCGEVVNRADYKRLANEIGIPSSFTTFTLPCPRIQNEWIVNAPWTVGANLAYTNSLVGIGTTNTSGTNLKVGGTAWMTKNILIGAQIAPSRYIAGGDLEHLSASIFVDNPNTASVDECVLLLGNGKSKVGLSLASQNSATGLLNIYDSVNLMNRFSVLANYYPRPIPTSTEIFTVLHNGNVGIGTTNPNKKLQVIGDVSITGNLTTTLSISYNTIALNIIPLTPLPNAGNIEYDGTVMYSSVGFGYRGAITSRVYYAPAANSMSFQNNTSIQTIFAKNITLVSDKSYTFKMLLNKTRSATSGTFVTHTIKLGFAGTAILSTMNYTAVSTRNAVPNTTNAIQTHIQVNGSSIVVVTAGLSNLSDTTIIEIEGFIRCPIGGTFIPQLQYSTAPMTTVVGYTDVLNEGSYISFEPIGSATATEFGNTWV